MELLVLLAFPGSLVGGYVGAWLQGRNRVVLKYQADEPAPSNISPEIEWGTQDYADFIGTQLDYWRKQARNNRTHMAEKQETDND